MENAFLYTTKYDWIVQQVFTANLILMPSRYITEKDNRIKKKHIVRTPCAHYGKEMAMEDDNVYLEVNPL